MRYCPDCDEERPLSEFYPDKRVKDGLTRRCRTHHSRSSYESRQKRLASPSQRREYNRRYWRARRYGLLPADFDALLAAQDGVCAICRQAETDTWRGNVKDLAVDHDHETGRVRGLLCAQCNTALGKFRDDAELLRAAMSYLNTCCEGAPQ